MQIGAGTKSAYIGGSPGATNNNNSITINQSGTGNNSAIVAMTDSTSNSVASITQSGPDKSFTLSMSGVGVSATVVQTNPTAGDTGSMVIQCYTPPCSGYSYIRN